MFNPDYSTIFCKFSVNGNAPDLSLTSLHHIIVLSVAVNGANVDKKKGPMKVDMEAFK